MQQQIQINQPPERVLNDAASFFMKRRARVSDRTERGFNFGLPGGASEEPGTVTITPGTAGASTVTVRADGIGLLALAESLVRELRKQARDQDRGGQRAPREGGVQTMRGDFSALRERLGMPPPEREPRGEDAPPPRRALVPGEDGPPQAPIQPPEEQDKHDGRPPSAEQAGGVPASEEVQAAAPSESAKAASGTGSPETAPSVDPSTANPTHGT